MNIEEYNQSVDLFSDRIYRFILKNIKDKELSEDIVQDTYEKLWLNYKNISFEKCKSYLFKIAYNQMIDFIRKNKRISKLTSADIRHYTHNEHYSDLQSILNEAINKLPDDQRSVILLRDYEGYSYEEIGEITGLNESQVKVYIYRARVFLKNYIISIENVV